MFSIGKIEFDNNPLFLAPMEDVSDPPFRYLCKHYGADMMYTEFISSEGLIRDAQKSLKKLELFGYERPIGIQLFGNNIESMIEATKIAEAAKPDLIDMSDLLTKAKEIEAKIRNLGATDFVKPIQKVREDIELLARQLKDYYRTIHKQDGLEQKDKASDHNGD